MRDKRRRTLQKDNAPRGDLLDDEPHNGRGAIGPAGAS